MKRPLENSFPYSDPCLLRRWIPRIVIAFGYVSVFTGTPLDPFCDPTILLIIRYSVRRLPYTVRAAYAGFQQTSVSLEEVSLSVGASRVRTLFSITIPLIMANVIAGGIMSFSAAMMEVSTSMILANREAFYPITKAIYSVNLRLGDGPYLASALGIVGTIIVTSCLLAANKLLGKSMGSYSGRECLRNLINHIRLDKREELRR